ncbi:MAG: metallophosphoesterase [Coriobacteriia bacterium]|nr:metallophosphoesterase [Coriobacteriia bacterium]
MLTRRQFIAGAMGAAASATGLWFYATEGEPFWVDVVERVLRVRGLPDSLVGRRLVHLSDLHVGEYVPDDYLFRSFERVATYDPAIVVITGDLTQHTSLEHASSVYARLPRGRLATVCTFGNHDYGTGWSEPDKADALAAMLTDQGISVLRNETFDVAGLQIIGMDDLWARRFSAQQALSSADISRAAVCLSHNPDTVDTEGWSGFEGWILAGHTHGGQVRPPFMDPPRLPVENKRYTSGEFELSGGRKMYISRGLGFLRQLRFNARPEVTVFELRGA